MTTEPTPPTMILCRRSGAFIGVVLCAALQTGLGCQQSSQQETVQSATTEAAGAKEPNVAATPAPPPPYQFDRSRLGLFSPLPNVMESPNNTITEAKTKLGRMLYYDERLSKNHDVSCNSCHDLLNYYGAENKAVSVGHKKQMGRRNAPSVYNAAGHFVQFWDGRSPTVEHQATQPLVNPLEMAANDKLLVRTLSSMPVYVKAFKEAFPGDKKPVTMTNFGIAIGAFERQLVTPSRWDKFLNGDDAALTDAEKRGLDKFIDTGCTACHNGPYLGGQLYQKAGLIKPWPSQKDQGRFEITKQDSDKMMFKVPTLRNVEKTPPYFSDGSVNDLHQAVAQMAEYQLGKKLSDADLNDIVFWLQTLTGTIPAELVQKPKLPPSGPTTPKPDAT